MSIEIAYHLPPGSVLPHTFTRRKKPAFINGRIKIMFVGSHVLVPLVKDGVMDEIREVLEQSDPAWNPPS